MASVLDPAGRRDLPPGPGAVEFRGVHFSYPGSTSVLKGVDFQAKPGETIALVGATGSGKSTAMALLQRLWDAEAGAPCWWTGTMREQLACISICGTGLVHRSARNLVAEPCMHPGEPADRRSGRHASRGW